MQSTYNQVTMNSQLLNRLYEKICMGFLCCYDIVIDDEDEVYMQQKRDEQRLRSSRNVRRHGPSRISTRDFSIKEDALLEDMCELADIEYEGDATKMSNMEKSNMLKRLSKQPKTENYFKSERALSEFYENR